MLGTMLVMGVGHRRTLSRVADTDPLTGLLNRRCLTGRERNLLSREGFGTAFTVALLDVDHFKAINDRYGHNVGDEVLKHFAALLAASAGKDDVVARWGGEEFVMVSRHRSAAHAMKVLEGVRGRLPQEVEAKGAGIQVRSSAGVTSSPQGEPLHTAIARADRALYRAKELGRDRFEIEDVTAPTSPEGPPARIGLALTNASVEETRETDTRARKSPWPGRLTCSTSPTVLRGELQAAIPLTCQISPAGQLRATPERLERRGERAAGVGKRGGAPE
ncbi:GGDEF domain-containing protein [Sphingomonas yunnanensis]|uniref:GGDEF domain-containing protein n=1 Tax=Sphingomonas yunnanensis TaxID=310400 RepID=UPI001CA6E7AB|nr:GGDEF domain-containing protein [Sphingomonas yunnanensis]MBY9064355.1 GGDEF domain-containing protein [Sphingomonas yunnanensis]